MPGDRVGLEIRALNGVAEVDQHLGDPAHATAANSHEVNRVDTAHAVTAVRTAPPLDIRPLEIDTPVLVGAPVDHAAPSAAICRQDWANSSAARGLASRRARSAMASSLPRPSQSFCNSPASRSA